MPWRFVPAPASPAWPREVRVSYHSDPGLAPAFEVLALLPQCLRQAYMTRHEGVSEAVVVVVGVEVGVGAGAGVGVVAGVGVGVVVSSS